MHTLYYSPAASSLAVHIALEEASLPYQLECFSTREGHNRDPEYLKINPLGQVPALRLPDGQVMTQVLALLSYVAEIAPARRLLPNSGYERTRCLEQMSFLATSPHAAFRNWYRPALCVPDEAAQRAVRDAARTQYFDLLKHVEAGLESERWLSGDNCILADAQAFCFYLWGQIFEWPVAELTRYRGLAQRVAARPATQRALTGEGFAGDHMLRIG